MWKTLARICENFQTIEDDLRSQQEKWGCHFPRKPGLSFYQNDQFEELYEPREERKQLENFAFLWLGPKESVLDFLLMWNKKTNYETMEKN